MKEERDKYEEEMEIKEKTQECWLVYFTAYQPL